MDVGTLFGLLLSLLALVASNLAEGGRLGSLLNLGAFTLIIGGTLGATTLGLGFSAIRRIPSLLRQAFTLRENQREPLLTSLVDLADKARRGGLLSLEQELDMEEQDPLLTEGIRLVADGFDEATVRQILGAKITQRQEGHRRGATVFQTMGGYSPTMGIIGTVMGLITVLQKLGGDTSELGQGIALAFMATFYGIFFANVVFLPIAANLRKKGDEDLRHSQAIVEAIIGYQTEEHPMLMQQRLAALLNVTELPGPTNGTVATKSREEVPL
ncbi:MAG: motility protein A [Candidatus Methylomirabilia bacterium]